MGYRRMDFRPDHLPAVIDARGYWARSIQGWKWYPISSRGASSQRADWKDTHTKRQRAYDRELVRKWLGGDDV